MIMCEIGCPHNLIKESNMSISTTNDGADIYYKDLGHRPSRSLSHDWPLNADAWVGVIVYNPNRTAKYLKPLIERRSCIRPDQSRARFEARRTKLLSVTLSSVTD